MGVDVYHEGLIGVVEHGGILIVELLGSFHEGHGRLAGEGGRRRKHRI